MTSERDAERTAIKLAFDPAEYLCTWRIPLSNGDVTAIPGLLIVQAGHPPAGQIYGSMPIKWSIESERQRSAGFPQHVDTDVLTARLSNGAHAVLTDVRVTYWLPDQGHIVGAAAVLGLEHPPSGVEPRYFSIDLQVEGLDAVSGVAPLKRTSWPNHIDTRHLEGTWSAEGNPESSQEWSDNDADMQLDYALLVRGFDAYSFRMSFSPVVRIEVTSALTIREWVRRWVEPIRRVVSIATGEMRELTYFATSTPAREQRTFGGQVFGAGITQEPYQSDQARVRDMRSALLLKVDDASLLEIVRAWQRFETDRHPLIETYGVMLTSPAQHPRSRFLLLVQALEGLHGYQTREDFEVRQRRHREQREAVLGAVSDHLDADTMRFIRRYLRNDPPISLEDALRAAISDLPVDLMPRLDETELVRLVREEHPEVTTAVAALRVVRNDLAHGVRGYDPSDLQSVVQILEGVVRSQALRLLGCPESAIDRVIRSTR